MGKENILKMLNYALELEYSAHIQYMSHAEIIDGPNAEPIIERLKEIAEDEKKHQEKFRKLIGALGGVPSIKMAEAHSAGNLTEILEQNLKDEKEAVDTYRKILDELKNDKEKKGYYDFLLEHDIRHILMEEQEHITELELLLGISGSSY